MIQNKLREIKNITETWSEQHLSCVDVDILTSLRIGPPDLAKFPHSYVSKLPHYTDLPDSCKEDTSQPLKYASRLTCRHILGDCKTTYYPVAKGTDSSNQPAVHLVSNGFDLAKTLYFVMNIEKWLTNR